jgi:hypothetical protein
MATAYMLRHQHAGILTSHVFLSHPTREQLEPLISECERLHGAGGWTRLHEVEALATGELPAAKEPEPVGTDESVAPAPKFAVSAEGSVS